MAIYTKRGDKGKTSLYDKASTQRERARLAGDGESRRVSKDSLRIRAIGALDEFNSYLGVAIASSQNPNLIGNLKEVQRNLFLIGSILAGSKLRFFKTKTGELEKEIDKLEGMLPVLKNFILPGGATLAAHLQYARAICRRAEREVVSLSEKNTVKPQILTYLNRLSDYLFMLARNANFKTEVEEEAWVGKKR